MSYFDYDQTDLPPIYKQIYPPNNYDQRKIQKDLIELALKNYSIVPYQKGLKAKWYYTHYKRRIDSFVELIDAEKQMWIAMREYRMELEKLKMIDLDIENLKLDKLIEYERKKRQYQQLLDSDKDNELTELKRQKDLIKLKLDLGHLQKKLNEFDKEKEPDDPIKKRSSDVMSQMEALKHITLAKYQSLEEMKRLLKSKGVPNNEIEQIVEDFEQLLVQEKIFPDRG